MFDINSGELLVIALVAVVLLGPDRLPEYVRGLRGLARRARDFVRDGRASLERELGDEVDWSRMDPRQYDPRTIVRDALFDDDATPATGTAAVATVAANGPGPSRRERRTGAAGQPRAGQLEDGQRAPFDDEAT